MRMEIVTWRDLHAWNGIRFTCTRATGIPARQTPSLHAQHSFCEEAFRVRLVIEASSQPDANSLKIDGQLLRLERLATDIVEAIHGFSSTQPLSDPHGHGNSRLPGAQLFVVLPREVDLERLTLEQFPEDRGKLLNGYVGQSGSLGGCVFFAIVRTAGESATFLTALAGSRHGVTRATEAAAVAHMTCQAGQQDARSQRSWGGART